MTLDSVKKTEILQSKSFWKSRCEDETKIREEEVEPASLSLLPQPHTQTITHKLKK